MQIDKHYQFTTDSSAEIFYRTTSGEQYGLSTMVM